VLGGEKRYNHQRRAKKRFLYTGWTLALLSPRRASLSFRIGHLETGQNIVDDCEPTQKAHLLRDTCTKGLDSERWPALCWAGLDKRKKKWGWGKCLVPTGCAPASLPLEWSHVRRRLRQRRGFELATKIKRNPKWPIADFSRCIVKLKVAHLDRLIVFFFS
jgi:hypothetical protein